MRASSGSDKFFTNKGKVGSGHHDYYIKTILIIELSDKPFMKERDSSVFISKIVNGEFTVGSLQLVHKIEEINL